MSAEHPNLRDMIFELIHSVPLRHRSPQRILTVLEAADLRITHRPASVSPPSPTPVHCVECGRPGRLITGSEPPRVEHWTTCLTAGRRTS